MNVKYLLLCEKFIEDAEGRPSLINIYDTIEVKSLPAVRQNFLIALSVWFDYTDIKSRDSSPSIIIEMKNPDGKAVFKAEGAMEINKSKIAEPGVNIVSNLDLSGKVSFEKQGLYSIGLLIDDLPYAETFLKVVLKEKRSDKVPR